MAKKDRKNATIAWLERSNPLRGLSIAQANNIFDAARNGDTQRLHWMFQEIETANPVLSMCVTRRSGAAANFRWSNLIALFKTITLLLTTSCICTSVNVFVFCCGWMPHINKTSSTYILPKPAIID